MITPEGRGEVGRRTNLILFSKMLRHEAQDNNVYIGRTVYSTGSNNNNNKNTGNYDK